LYAPPVGNAAIVVVPFIFSICCWECINIPAIAGPMALPMILIKVVIPVEIPIDCVISIALRGDINTIVNQEIPYRHTNEILYYQ
jgi:hypothetical protein